MRIDSDAVMWSAPERERASRPLIVLMHGYGSHEGDLFGLAPGLPLGPVIASVRAPIAESGGWAWFSRIDSPVGDPPSERADAAASAILEWLDSIEYTTVTLIGFSQGGAMALHLLRRAPERFASAVCLSGFVIGGEQPGDAELERLRPPVFWGRGTLDQVIPDAAIERTQAWLPSHSDLTERVYEDLGHSISAPELADFSRFLAQRL